jgi:hypothetical protein
MDGACRARRYLPLVGAALEGGATGKAQGHTPQAEAVCVLCQPRAGPFAGRPQHAIVTGLRQFFALSVRCNYLCRTLPVGRKRGAGPRLERGSHDSSSAACGYRYRSRNPGREPGGPRGTGGRWRPGGCTWTCGPPPSSTRERRPPSVRRRLSALSSFYRYCAAHDLIGRVPTEGVARPAVDPHPQLTYPVQHLRAEARSQRLQVGRGLASDIGHGSIISDHHTSPFEKVLPLCRNIIVAAWCNPSRARFLGGTRRPIRAPRPERKTTCNHGHRIASAHGGISCRDGAGRCHGCVSTQ